MKKQLIIIHGTMGIGKSTVCERLNKVLPKSVWLDGDWCWMMDPWLFSDENKAMVIDNITHILNNFLANSEFEYIIFSWVIHYETIFNDILKPLSACDFGLHKLTLMCEPEALRERMKKAGREAQQIEASLNRLSLYETMDTIKIDTSYLSPSQVVQTMKSIIIPD
jgi:broad-specificity NMP kinase